MQENILAGESPSMLKPDIHIRKMQSESTRLVESLRLRVLIPVLNTGVRKLLMKNIDAQSDIRLSHTTIKRLM